MDVISSETAASVFPVDGWCKATASDDGGAGGCVGVNLSRAGEGLIGLRHERNPEASVMVFDAHEWACFLDGAKGGEFDLPC